MRHMLAVLWREHWGHCSCPQKGSLLYNRYQINVLANWSQSISWLVQDDQKSQDGWAYADALYHRQKASVHVKEDINKLDFFLWKSTYTSIVRFRSSAVLLRFLFTRWCVKFIFLMYPVFVHSTPPPTCCTRRHCLLLQQLLETGPTVHVDTACTPTELAN